MIGEIPWQPSSFCQTKVGSFGQWRDDPSPEHRMDGWERPFRAVATRLLRSLARMLRRNRPSCIRATVRQMLRRAGKFGRLATVGLRQPAHSLPTIPTRFANSAAGRLGEDGAVTVALRMNDDQREGLAGGACLTVLDDGRGDGRKKR